MIVIRRGKNLRYESAVDVFQADHGHWTIDPAQEMFDATKLHISRYNCIISFSAGISAAGHPVFIEKNRRGLGDVLERFEQRGRTITFCYFLLGLAWVRNEWDAIKRMLAKVEALPADSVDELCEALCERVPELSSSELELCFQELKSLCNAKERQQVVRLLAGQAAADGQVEPSEQGELSAIAAELGVAEELLGELVTEALTRVSSERPADRG